MRVLEHRVKNGFYYMGRRELKYDYKKRLNNFTQNWADVENKLFLLCVWHAIAYWIVFYEFALF